MKVLPQAYCQGCGRFDTLFEIKNEVMRCAECIKASYPERFAEVFVEMRRRAKRMETVGRMHRHPFVATPLKESCGSCGRWRWDRLHTLEEDR